MMREYARQALRRSSNLRRISRPASRSLATARDSLHKDPVELDQISRLPNGVRVATESLPGPFSGVGVYVDAGSRYENESLRGCSHIVDRLAFKSTNSRTGDQMLEAMETLGGNIQCASSREAMMYQSATFNSAVPSAVGLLAETIRNPLITDEEITQQIETADYEIREIWGKPELIIPELVHMAAYKDNTLGNPLLCPAERLSTMSKGLVEKYRDIFYQPERMVVAFAGVKHEDAVRLTDQYFGDMKQRSEPSVCQNGSETTISASVSKDSSASSSSNSSSPPSATSHSPPPPSTSSKLLSKVPFFANMSTSSASHASVSPLDPSFLQSSTLNLSAPSYYTGGFLALPPIPPPASPLQPPLTHIHVAFEALPISSPDIYALATLQTLLGGGGSFSAGGPGKGMYSRLYTNVLNQHGWIDSCVAFNHSYTDSGLFGIAGSCIPSQAGALVDVICSQLADLMSEHGIRAPGIIEVNRAKNQLRSSLLMNLESRLVELEDLGRQVQVHGHKIGVKEMCEKIEKVTVNDIKRVARLVFRGKVENEGHGTGAPTVVVQEGEVAGEKKAPLPWEDVQNRIRRWKLGRM